MTRPLAVLRPEPGASATAARIAALGLEAVKLPLFEVRPLAWHAPDPAAFDSLLLTSANAVRHAGPELARLAGLPVLAVGAATAAAAETAGLRIAHVGARDAAALLEQAAALGFTRALHLAGRERTVEAGGGVARIIPVYASEPRAIGRAQAARIEGTVALVHSARAGRRLAEIADSAGLDRSLIALAALSEQAGASAGSGWRARAIAERPDDPALIAAARTLAD